MERLLAAELCLQHNAIYEESLSLKVRYPRPCSHEEAFTIVVVLTLETT